MSRLNAELTRSEASLAEAQSIARIGSWELDITTLASTWSRQLYRLFDFGLDETPDYEALIRRVHPDDREASIEAIEAAMVEYKPFLFEHRIVLTDGSERWVCARGRVERDSNGQPRRLLATAQDITEQKDAEKTVVHLAFHDLLTGLPNRLLCLDRLGQALKRLSRQALTTTVIYVDIDRFNVINDSLGHPVGDQLLRAMSDRLTDFVRPGDTLARVGGDEFVVLCEGLSGEDEAVGIADRICAAMAEPLAWDRGELKMSVSAGIAIATTPWVSANALMRDAVAAMYRAKSEGRGRTSVYAKTMRAKAVARLETEMSLRQSIDDGDLRVYYQPIVDVASGAVLGHEALVRWSHPMRGLLEPNLFIPIAEETGLIVPIGAWVLREACRQAKQIQLSDPSRSDLTMSVNLSGGQLSQPDLIALVTSALQDADLTPEHLQLEMTESILMGDEVNTISVLETLRGLGVRLSVDDFGTGYSSLSYLKRFPVDGLKIDRSFVKGLGTSAEDLAIVAAVLGLAAALDLTVTAEGVETETQRECLAALGCLRAQGFLFSRPVPAWTAMQSLSEWGASANGRTLARPHP